jgi:hypothetical protein
MLGHVEALGRQLQINCNRFFSAEEWINTRVERDDFFNADPVQLCTVLT